MLRLPPGPTLTYTLFPYTTLFRSFTDGIATPNPATGAGAGESAFVNGSVPMMFFGPNGISTIAKARGPGFADKVGVGMVPKDESATSFVGGSRSEEHTSEIQSLMRSSYAVFCLKKQQLKPQT